MRRIFVFVSMIFLIMECVQRPQTTNTPEGILAQMRADTNWIHELDSMAQIALGPGAKCLDPVYHTFFFETKTWFFNQDWGGVLEIPSDYIPEEDLWQAELSFHGTRAWSPDSLILVSFYAGFQALTKEETNEAIMSSLKENGFAVQEWDEKEKVVTIRARSAEGINYYERHTLTNDDGVEFSVSVQYPDEKESDALPLIEMADRYPVGPNGIIFKGGAL